MSTITPLLMDEIKRKAGDAMESVEGPNEYDLSGDPDWVNTLRNYQRDLYDSVKGNPSTANVPVVDPSVGDPRHYCDKGAQRNTNDGLRSIEARADYGNWHPYPQGRKPGYSLSLEGYHARFVSCSYPSYSPTRRHVATETGYHNALDNPATDHEKPVSEQAAARYIPRTFLEYFEAGFSKTYTYEFIDLYPDSEKDETKKNWGLLRNDGARKPAYNALRNLIELLEDPGSSFTPDSLGYSLSGNTTDMHHTLLQKRNGRFYLILWQEVESYDTATNQEVSVPEERLTLTLNAPFAGTAATYLPTNSPSATARYSGPIASLTLDVPDHPLVVELTPDSAFSPEVWTRSGSLRR